MSCNWPWCFPMEVLQRRKIDFHSSQLQLPGLDFHRFLLRGGSRFNEPLISMVRFGDFLWEVVDRRSETLKKGGYDYDAALTCNYCLNSPIYKSCLMNIYIYRPYYTIAFMFLHRMNEELHHIIYVSLYQLSRGINSSTYQDFQGPYPLQDDLKHLQNFRSLMVNLGWTFVMFFFAEEQCDRCGCGSSACK